MSRSGRPSRSPALRGRRAVPAVVAAAVAGVLGALAPAGPVHACCAVRDATLADPAVTEATAATQSGYVPLSPTRILDTRHTGQALGPAASLTLTVTGGSVPAGAAAVAMNITVTNPTQGSYLSLFPAGEPRPAVSNLNFSPGETIANLVMVPVGTGGAVTLFNARGRVDVVADLEGYFAPGTAGSGAGMYMPLTPARITDTRAGSGYPNAGSPVGAGQSLDVQVTGAGGVPASGVAAAVLNVTVTGATQASFLTVYPAGQPRPGASNLNFGAGQTSANRVIVSVGPTGMVAVYNQVGSANVVVDVSGYFTAAGYAGAAGGYLSPLGPVRLLDTRATGATLGPGGVLPVQVAGVDGIAPGAVALAANVTATGPTAGSYLTVYPSGTRPDASDVNFAAGETVPNLTLAGVSQSGSVSIFNARGDVDVVVDVFGFFAPPGSIAPPPPLAVTTVSVPGGTVGSSYPATSLTATGGVPPYAWSVQSGALPPGLSLSASGVLSGTPTTQGSFSFTVQVSDAESPPGSATGTFAVAVAADALPVTVQESGNWSGYILEGGPFTRVTGTFVVPSLYADAAAGSSMSEWVGIDGATNTDLIQAGIEEDPIPAQPGHFALTPWWEILPAAATPITSLAVQPGQTMTVTIGQVSGDLWQITLLDGTTGASFSTEQVYAGPGESAEWIVEAPQVNGVQVQLADYTPTAISGLGVTGAGSAWVEVRMVQGGVQVSTPSPLDSAGFAVQYGATAPPAP